jgi:pimeloyl-ACP methyl ester carboxylesterase
MKAWQYDAMALLQVNGAAVDVEQAGSGRDLVLLHSLLSDRSAFDRVVPLLRAKRRLCLVNLPGYGASAPAGTTIEEYADHIAALIQALRLPRDTDVLGNGLGGFIAVALAARHGAKFDRLIAAPALIAFPPPAKEPLRSLAARVEKDGMQAALDIAIRRMFPESFSTAHPEIVAERKRVLEKADAACFSTACKALASLDLAPVLPNVRNRTLVLAGSEDATTPPALARKLAESIKDARFVELAGCGHCPQIENPRAFVAAVEEFLA